MTSLHARAALLPEGWHHNVRLTIAGGQVATVETDAPPQSGDERHALIVPAMPNLHSHAFQRAMAGLTESRGPGEDSFWSWRQLMYRFALSMTPDQMEAVAALAYVEMLEAGFGRVGEFHYLHHDSDGRHYANIAELGGRIAAAAAETGIGLTLLPVFYAHSGFGGAAPLAEQRRFINDPDSFAALVEGCRESLSGLPSACLGIAPHSLRAASPEELRAILPLAEAGPVHIHVAEQTKEVEDCLAWSGARPVEFLLDNMPVDRSWCLIHATHMTDGEIARVAARDAVVGLCPITEANLGDGIFPARGFIAAGGRFGVGSDSNVLIGVADELRQLEYSQRLAHRARNVLARPGESTGRFLLERALEGGAAALGAASALAEGQAADLVSLSGEAMAHLAPDQALDLFVFTPQVRPDCVWVQGRKWVEGGRHLRREAVHRHYHAALGELLNG